LQLVEQGKLKLDDSIGHILYASTFYCSNGEYRLLDRPEVARAKIVDENGNLSSPETPITLRHLLTHTSGYSYGSRQSQYQTMEERAGSTVLNGNKAAIDLPLLFEVIP
jgi:CubicO group peptidase (beta-lactamase class C family)